MPRKGATTGRSVRAEGRSKTRSNKPRLIDSSSTKLEEQTLKLQLAHSGLYAANTLGDGNCLFRALSDQLTGNEASHEQIRSQVCEHLTANRDRYSPYIDSDSVSGGFDGHVRSMRQLGTYGTDIELTAFAHHYKRPIKVFQPGLVYVIQADDPAAASTSASTSQSSEPSNGAEAKNEDLTPREKRLKNRQEKLKNDKGKGKLASTEEKRQRAKGSLYIAYHSWEHYSSVRRIQGPHSGLPNIEPLAPIEQTDDHAVNEVGNLASAPDQVLVETPPAVQDAAEPTTTKRRGRPKKYPPENLNPTLLSAQSIALPPSRSASPASTPPPSVTLPDRSFDSPHLRPRSLSDSSGTSDSRMHQRSRRNSPQSSVASPASSLETDEDLEPEEKQPTISTGSGETKGSKVPLRPRRGPTAREKKEAQRKRRVELRRSKLGASQAKAAGSALGKGARGRTTAAGDEHVLMEVRELFI